MMFSRTVLPIAVLIAVLLPSSGVVASSGPTPSIQPRTYVSSNGEFTLSVDPHHINGLNGATYVAKRNGEVVWTSEEEFTLWHAGITDEGIAAGAGYTHGVEGNHPQWGKFGDLNVVVWSPTGRPVLSRRVERSRGSTLPSDPNPLAYGIVLHPKADRLLVRIINPNRFDKGASPEEWWVFSLSNGKELGKVAPGCPFPGQQPWYGAVQPILGTPLLLVQCTQLRRAGDQVSRDLTYFLADFSGKTVWQQAFPGVLEIDRPSSAKAPAAAYFDRHGGVLECDTEREFTILSVADAAAITLQVVPGGKGRWTVRELTRQAFEPPSDAEPEAPLPPDQPLRLLGELELESVAPPTALTEGVQEFQISPEGIISYLRPRCGGQASLVVSDRSGGNVKEVELPAEVATAIRDRLLHACVGQDRFLIYRSPSKDKWTAAMWIVDTARGQVTPAPLDSPAILTRMAPYPGGGFVAIGYCEQDGGSQYPVLLRADADGRPLWMVPSRAPANDPMFGLPESITATPEGQIATLHNIRDLVEFYDADGKHLRTIDLKAAWGRDPSYPTEIAGGRDDTFVIRDFNGPAELVRCNATGRILAEFTPRFAGGRRFSVADVHLDPAGAVWVSDQHALMRLDDRGTVAQVIGEAPESVRLANIALLTVDVHGRFYAVDQRSGSIHMFDPGGKLVQIAPATPEDFSVNRGWSYLSAADDAVLVGLNEEREGLGQRFVLFGLDGKRLQEVTTEVVGMSLPWYQQPSGDFVWRLDYHDVHLLDAGGRLIRTTSRRADGQWFVRPLDGAVAPDGSLAVLAANTEGFYWPNSEAELSVTILDPEGAPRSTFALPGLLGMHPTMAFDGERIVLAGNGVLLLMNQAGEVLLRSSTPPGENVRWRVFLRPEQKDLVLFDGSSRLLRYGLP